MLLLLSVEKLPGSAPFRLYATVNPIPEGVETFTKILLRITPVPAVVVLLAIMNKAELPKLVAAELALR